MKDPHCSRCYRGKAIEPRHLCQHHLKLNQRLFKKKQQRGLCYRCDKPAVEGLIVCETHAQLRSFQTAMTRRGRPPQRLTPWSPLSRERVIRLVYLTNPYLHRDWTTAKPFLHKHWKLWLPHSDTTWHHRIYVDDSQLRALCG